MEVYFILFFAIVALILLACVWRLVCNEWTYKDRIAMNKILYDQPDWSELSKEWWTVDYQKHVSEYFWFRDPMKLYSQRMRDLRKQNG